MAARQISDFVGNETGAAPDATVLAQLGAWAAIVLVPWGGLAALVRILLS